MDVSALPVDPGAMLETYLGLTDDGVTITDMDHKLVMWNDEFEARMGGDVQLEVGRVLSEILVGWRDVTPSYLRAAGLAMATKQPVERLVTTTRDGDDVERRWQLRTRAVPALGRFSPVVVITEWRDVTATMDVVSELARIQNLEMMGRLSKGFGADFNNVLCAINGQVALAKQFVNPDSPLHPRLRRFEDALGHSKELTRQLSTFSRGAVPSLEPMELGKVLSEAVTATVGDRPVEVGIKIASNLWPTLGDVGLVRQVIQNLVLNALQAMGTVGGQLRVSARNIALGATNPASLPPGSYVRVAIRDTGVGISEECLDRVFDPYYTTKAQGSGLGLASALGIVLAHGGALTVASRVGEGSTFTFYLRATKEDEPSRRSTIKHLFMAKGRLLVLEPSAAIREVLGDFMSQVGYDIVTCMDGNEAVTALKRSLYDGAPFDVALVELVVKGAPRGEAIIEVLKRLHPSLVAIATSGQIDHPGLLGYRRAGFDATLPKPYTLEELSEKVFQLMAIHASRR